jgi:hypothetical protein
MDKKLLFGILSIILFASILFLPSGSSAWIYLAIAGIALGIAWLRSK